MHMRWDGMYFMISWNRVKDCIHSFVITSILEKSVKFQKITREVVLGRDVAVLTPPARDAPVASSSSGGGPQTKPLPRTSLNQRKISPLNVSTVAPNKGRHPALLYNPAHSISCVKTLGPL